MAKRLVRWNRDANILTISQVLEDNNKVDLKAEFDLAKIFPTFLTDNEIQQEIIVNGVKQRLADVGAGEKEGTGKISAAKEIWSQLLEGKWGKERVNATGKAEAVKLAKSIGEIRKAMEPEKLQAMRTLGLSLTPEETKVLADWESQEA